MNAHAQDELLDAAVKRTKEGTDFQSTFFISFQPEGLKGQALQELTDVVGNVKLWQRWASSLAALKTQEKIDSSALSNATDGQSTAQRSNYNSKVVDFLMRQGTWFAQTNDQNLTRHFDCESVDFHKDLINVMIDGFVDPRNIYESLHDALSSIADNIKLASQRIRDQQMLYFIMLTRFEYVPESESIRTIVRVINFQTDTSLTQYTVLKKEQTHVKLDFTYNQYQCDFNNKVFSQLRENLAGRLVDEGATFVNDANSMDITIPSG